MLILAVLFGILFFGVLMWLRYYTNHGQKLELPDYVGMEYSKAESDAGDKSFQLIVNDSIHIVGRKGGEIVDQNPEAYSKVKENRKVYVTLTKYNADVLKVSSLGVMYGQDYESKKNELSHLSISSEIKGYNYDTGEPNHILEVWYKGQPIITRNGRKDNIEIEKGGTLQFVLSKKQGGYVAIPNLNCTTYGAAKFILESSNLKLGEVNDSGPINDRTNAYVLSQDPPFIAGETISMGEYINLTIVQERPSNCN